MKKIKSINIDYYINNKFYCVETITNEKIIFEKYNNVMNSKSLIDRNEKQFNPELFKKLNTLIIDLLCVEEDELYSQDDINITVIYENGTDIENTVHTNLYEMNLNELADLLNEIFGNIELPNIFKKLK